jgi:acyl carrier protein
METLLALLERQFQLDGPVPADLPLLSSGLIDSLRVADLLVAVGDRFGVTIDPSEVGTDNFDTPRQMLAFLQGKR